MSNKCSKCKRQEAVTCVEGNDVCDDCFTKYYHKGMIDFWREK